MPGKSAVSKFLTANSDAVIGNLIRAASVNADANERFLGRFLPAPAPGATRMGELWASIRRDIGSDPGGFAAKAVKDGKTPLQCFSDTVFQKIGGLVPADPAALGQHQLAVGQVAAVMVPLFHITFTVPDESVFARYRNDPALRSDPLRALNPRPPQVPDEQPVRTAEQAAAARRASTLAAAPLDEALAGARALARGPNTDGYASTSVLLALQAEGDAAAVANESQLRHIYAETFMPMDPEKWPDVLRGVDQGVHQTGATAGQVISLTAPRDAAAVAQQLGSATFEHLGAASAKLSGADWSDFRSSGTFSRATLDSQSDRSGRSSEDDQRGGPAETGGRVADHGAGER